MADFIDFNDYMKTVMPDYKAEAEKAVSGAKAATAAANKQWDYTAKDAQAKYSGQNYSNADAANVGQSESYQTWKSATDKARDEWEKAQEKARASGSVGGRAGVVSSMAYGQEDIAGKEATLKAQEDQRMADIAERDNQSAEDAAKYKAQQADANSALNKAKAAHDAYENDPKSALLSAGVNQGYDAATQSGMANFDTYKDVWLKAITPDGATPTQAMVEEATARALVQSMYGNKQTPAAVSYAAKAYSAALRAGKSPRQAAVDALRAAAYTYQGG